MTFNQYSHLVFVGIQLIGWYIGLRLLRAKQKFGVYVLFGTYVVEMGFALFMATSARDLLHRLVPPSVATCTYIAFGILIPLTIREYMLSQRKVRKEPGE
jgi:hypothetical protein